jgi:hypothetical protein
MSHGGIIFLHPVAILLAVLFVVPLWRICTKAGYSGWLSLLTLIPIANLVLLYFLAFSTWPLERRASPPSPGGLAA